MDKYTELKKYPNVEEKIGQIIKQISDEMVSQFHPRSIILTSSFGSGEVTAFEEEGKLKFVSDCEIVIVPNGYISRRKIKEFTSYIAKEIGLQLSISTVILSIYFVVPRFNKKMKPTFENYNLKYCSKVLYGKNYLKKIPNFKPEDIPLWEGIRLLFNRMAESMRYYPSNSNLNRGDAYESIHWINKIILACQDVLLLSVGRYHCSYRVRNAIAQSLFPQHFSQLNEELPNFLPLTIKATKYKLTGEDYSENIAELWFNVAEICDKVFRYILRKEMCITFDTYLDFPKRYLEHPNTKKKYHREFLSFPVYQNLMILVKMKLLSTGTVSSKIITEIRTPWNHIIYSLIPLIYFGVSRNGEINKAYLRRVRNNLSWFKELKEPKQDVFDEYEYVKVLLLDLWYCICH